MEIGKLIYQAIKLNIIEEGNNLYLIEKGKNLGDLRSVV
jgi:hypothetical protein